MKEQGFETKAVRLQSQQTHQKEHRTLLEHLDELNFAES